MITPLIYKLLLAIHIAAGTTAFVFAPAALATVKGSKWHRTWGKIYFWMMALVALTAIIMATSPLRPNLFLSLVAIFSFYAAFRGYRVLYLKRPDNGDKAKWYDWLAMALTVAAGLGLLGRGALWIAEGNRFGWVAGAFSIVAFVQGYQSYREFTHTPTDRNHWWYSHMGGMLGSYIAAVTAFSAVNFPNWLPQVPQVVVWLWPSIIGVPVIAIWTAYYKIKFNKRKNLAKAS